MSKLIRAYTAEQAEYYPIADVNNVREHLRAGKTRYWIVLQA